MVQLVDNNPVASCQTCCNLQLMAKICSNNGLLQVVFKGIWHYFFIGLRLRTFEVTLKYVFENLIACLAFEILKDKDMTKR